MEKLLQASTLNALMLGNFDCTMSVGAFLRDADTGIGTYTGLDGEAIFEDGVAYRATADGVVTVMTAKDGVAFGTVSKFDASVPPVTLCGITSIETLKDELSLCIRENQNIFYMLKAIGHISHDARAQLLCLREALSDAVRSGQPPEGIPLSGYLWQCHRCLLSAVR